MEYSINKLSKMSGVTTRTLRYYDEIGLLKPERVASSGYRIYGQAQVDILQQILFYRELEFSLDDIKELLSAPDFNREQAFRDYLTALQNKQRRLEKLVRNVEQSIAAMKGETEMLDAKKFEGFKQNLLDKNEKAFGKELREKYGDEAVDKSDAKFKSMTFEQYSKNEELLKEVNDTLKAAVEQGDPASELAQKVCALHKQWLCQYWTDYTPEMHLGVAQMYVGDPRFSAYYDKLTPGAAVFLRDAIRVFCGESRP